MASGRSGLAAGCASSDRRTRISGSAEELSSARIGSAWPAQTEGGATAIARSLAARRREAKEDGSNDSDGDVGASCGEVAASWRIGSDRCGQ